MRATRIFILIVIFSSLLYCAATVENLPLNEAQASELLKNAEVEYTKLLKEVQENSWRSDSSNRFPTKQMNDEARQDFDQFRNYTVELCEKLRVIPYGKFQNATLKRQIRLLSTLQINGLDEEDYQAARKILYTMARFPTTNPICSYRNPIDCSIVYLPDINDCFIRTLTPNEMEYYWVEWRNAIKEHAKSLYRKYVELYRKAAALNGHITPSRTWYQHFEDDDFFSEMSAAFEELKPFYTEFHAYIRYRLRQKYGEDALTEDGPIPEHLVEQVQLQAWRQHSVIDPPHPEKHLPNVKESMNRLNYNPRKLIHIGEEFFKTLGFNELPNLEFFSTFWDDSIKIIPEDAEGEDCKNKVYDLTSDVALRFCSKSDFRKFNQMHATMATVFYNILKRNQPVGLNREMFPGFGSVIGEAITLSASTPKHLENINLIENYSMDQALTLNRLYRLGTHTMLTIPMYFAYEKFWIDSIDHRIKEENYNCEYWKIREELTGVEPPESRSEFFLDPGYRFYWGLDDSRSSTVKFLSELMGYQIYRWLCLKTGQYVPGNASLPLHNCDFYRQKTAGDLIIKTMSMGAKAHWRDGFEILTGERKLSAKAILEFYEPLHTWLKAFNEENGVEVGWETNEKCEKD